MVPFAGWEMPVQYKGIIEEHEAVRKSAGLFDVSHMGEARVEGSGAAAFLDYISTNYIGNLKPGCARYTIMCMEDGGCVDDIIVYRESEESFFICLNASNTSKDIDWMQQHVGNFECEVKDVSADYAQLALQGPKAAAVLAELTDVAALPDRPFRMVTVDVGGIEMIVSTTGYTGEKGYELYLAPSEACPLAEKLLAAGAAFGLQPAGLGARDSLRLEMGYPLYGHEISESISPLQAGLGWVVKLKKESFIGRDALERQALDGCESRLVFFTMNDRRIAREGTEVVDAGGNVCGKVLSGTHSPTLGCPIGSALVDLSAGESFSARIRKKDYPLEIKTAPLVETSLTKK